MELDDYRKMLKIDRHNLDEELIQQASHFMGVAEAFALAVSKREFAKEEVNRVAARLYVRFRKNQAEGEKVTEAQINAKISKHEDHIAARDGYKQASEDADRWLALKEAFHQRSFMLRELARLYDAGYWQPNSSAGKSPRDHERDVQRTRKTLSDERKRRRLDD